MGISNSIQQLITDLIARVLMCLQYPLIRLLITLLAVLIFFENVCVIFNFRKKIIDISENETFLL